MRTSIFKTLSALADDFDRAVRDLPAGPERDRLEVLVQRLDAVIERTIGAQEVDTTNED